MKTRWLALVAGTMFLIPIHEAHACEGHDMGGVGAPQGGQGNRQPDREPEKPEPPPVIRPSRQIQIEITEKGFVPNQIEVKVKEWVEFVITRKTDQTCASRVIFDLGQDGTIQHNLPLGQAVTFRSRFERSGTVSFGCPRDMPTGSVAVR